MLHSHRKVFMFRYFFPRLVDHVCRYLTVAGAVSLLTGTLERQRSGLTMSRRLPLWSRSRLKDSHLSRGCILRKYPCLARAALHISPRFDIGHCPYLLSYVGAQVFTLRSSSWGFSRLQVYLFPDPAQLSCCLCSVGFIRMSTQVL